MDHEPAAWLAGALVVRSEDRIGVAVCGSNVRSERQDGPRCEGHKDWNDMPESRSDTDKVGIAGWIASGRPPTAVVTGLVARQVEPPAGITGPVARVVEPPAGATGLVARMVGLPAVGAGMVARMVGTHASDQVEACLPTGGIGTRRINWAQL